VSGGEYGWRSGSGKWPDYYADSLPGTIDIGPGSPTGVASGTGAKFPAKYQRALFVNDWTYGTMWAIHLTPEGASYKAEKEEFIFGKPLPLTDVVIHPQDGAMYFAVGGRRTQSGVYRVTYVGDESTARVSAAQPTEETRMRAELERLHLPGADAEQVIGRAWPYLSHSDRHLRFAARTAIERLPVDLWQEKALAETHPQASIEAISALARQFGTKTVPISEKPKPGSSSAAISPVKPEHVGLQQRMFESLGKLGNAKLSTEQSLAALRAVQLVLIRLGKPGPELCADIAQALDAMYPAPDARLNRELCQILIAVDSPKVVAKTLSLMATAKDDWEAVASEAVLSRNDRYANAAKAAEASRPNRQQIAYMFALRNATVGWTPDLRRTFFSWFPRARVWKGGNSFKGFIENIRKEALATFTPQEEIAEMDALSSKSQSVTIPNFVAPKGPGRAWTVDEVLALAKDGIKGRNFENGKNMFSATMCLACHRFNGDGGGIGPDVTGVGNRYTLRDLLENIVEPSKVISDQYDSHQIEKKDGSTLIGRVIVQENGKTFVMTNPFAPNDHIAINDTDIASKKIHPVSMMPPGLINALNEDELLDLLAYMLSAGNPEDKTFKK
jgi:putative heme-binding domain-containing protein